MRKEYALAALLLCSAKALAFQTTIPFHGCTFYRADLLKDFERCADFSVKRGRSRCKKTKGSPPLMTTYPGDHVQMWLPDYFIEVTKHAGKSLFATSTDGLALKAQLESSSQNYVKNGAYSSSGGDNFWHARILGVPYGSVANSFAPVPTSVENAVPGCFRGVSEFYNDQWNLNRVDAPYAAAFAPLGLEACLSLKGAPLMTPEVKGSLDKIKGISGVSSSMAGVPCAVPLSQSQMTALNALPTAEPSRTASDLSRLCMGTWGNLIPRTGWIPTDDLSMSALIAAFKFQSLAADLQISPDLAPRSDDKWQIVFPKQIGFESGSCFRPGSLSFTPSADLGREGFEFEQGGLKKNHTYVIAVWRRRDTCEEPLPFEAHRGAYRAHFAKNKALCYSVGSL